MHVLQASGSIIGTASTSNLSSTPRWPWLMRLLPLWDACAVLSAAQLASLLHGGVETPHAHEIWALPLAIIAPFVMFMKTAATASLMRHALPRLLAFVAAATLIASVSPDAPTAGWFAIWLAASCGLLLGLRGTLRTTIPVQTLALVGAGPVADRLIRYLRRSDAGRFKFVGAYDDRGARGAAPEQPPIGSISDLVTLSRSQHIDWIVITLPDTATDRVATLMQTLGGIADRIGLCPTSVGLRLPSQRTGRLGTALPLKLLADTSKTAWELDDCDLADFTRVAAEFGQERYSYVVTPNVDHLIRLHEDAEFRGLYADAGYVLLDSRFLSHLLRFLRGLHLPVCTGSDLTATLFEQVIVPDDNLVLIGGSAEQAAALAARYGLRRLAHHNPPMNFIRDPEAVETCLRFIEAQGPFRFCLLAIGSPQQEIIAHKLMERGRARGLALCVGASIDFLMGTAARAPLWMQSSGLEWVHRLTQAPGRMAKRYLLRGPRVFSLLRRTDIMLRVPA